MIEFKQIIGRGTRTYDGKSFFIIWDFVKAYENFNDPEWDGEPVDPEPPKEPRKPGEPDGDAPPSYPPVHPPEKPSKIVITLSDGSKRKIQNIAATMCSQSFLI